MSEVDSTDYWEHFIKSVGKTGDQTFSWVFLVPFKESLRCFKAEAYLAACAMCRVSVEALLHTAKTVKHSDVIINFGEREQLVGATYRNPEPKTRFHYLFKWAKGEHLLDGLESKVEYIRDDGDYSVHLAQKLDKEISLTPEIWLSKMLNLRQNLQVVDKETARQRILDTEEIILQVIHKKWPL